MSEQVRVGVIGTSWFADGFHLPNLKSHPGAKLVGICGRNRDRAEEMATKYGIPLAFTDYGEMIEKAALQAIVVITPDDRHYPMTMDALDAGLHVLCTKPLASNASQASEMYERAGTVGVKHMTYFTYRWLPHYTHAKALVDEGFIGRCYQCSFSYLAGFARGGEYSWRYDSQRAHGALGDLGTHVIDLARWYVGAIAEVSANLDVFVERRGPDDGPLDPANDVALVSLRFANGAQGVLHVSAVAHLGSREQGQQVLLHGESVTLLCLSILPYFSQQSCLTYVGTEGSGASAVTHRTTHASDHASRNPAEV